MSKKKPQEPDDDTVGLDSLLDNWQVLNKYISKITEEQAWALLNNERADKKRPQFLLRLYGRYNTMRTQRERSELLAE